MDAVGQTDDDLLLSRADGILTIVLNRPRRKNALTTSMIGRVIDAVEEAAVDDTTRVVVLRATGADFCTGIDLMESNRADRDGASSSRPRRPRAGHLQRGFPLGPHRMIQSICAAQVPVVAAVQGWAAGIGNALALSADVTIAADSARFWVPFVTKGFTPDSGNSWLIPRLVGVARAKEMILRGRPVDGPTAASWGLVSECVPDPDLAARADAVAAEFAGMATVAVGLAKSLLHTNLESSFAAGLQNEGVYEELAVRSDDFKEGMRAFAEKRQPGFTGW